MKKLLKRLWFGIAIALFIALGAATVTNLFLLAISFVTWTAPDLAVMSEVALGAFRLGAVFGFVLGVILGE